jgi:hypothetical protein
VTGGAHGREGTFMIPMTLCQSRGSHGKRPPLGWWRRTGQGEEDDLLIGPLLGRVVVDRDSTCLDVLALLGPWDVPMYRWRHQSSWVFFLAG